MQRDFYNRTQENERTTRRDLRHPSKRKMKRQASSENWYKIPALLLSLTIVVLSILLLQVFMTSLDSFSSDVRGGYEEAKGFFHIYPVIYVQLFILVCFPAIWAYANHKLKAIWRNNNAMYLSDDIEEYINDAYVQTMDHITQSYEPVPDAGLGFDSHVSAIVSHAMISNTGIKKIDMPEFDPHADGQVKRDSEGNIVTKKMPMFDEDFGRILYNFSNVPAQFQKFFNAKEYDFNPKANKQDRKKGVLRQGGFGRKEYDTLADYINNEFYPLPTETQRPSGVYFADSRPVNTILIAITRGGKG